MSDLELLHAPATELARLIRARELSPVELMTRTLGRIETVDAALNCFCFVYPEEAMASAREAEDALARGDVAGPLHGLPVGIKDVTPTRGKRTTRGSRMYEHWVPDHDAIIVRRLLDAGAIMVGKTTSPEFAYDGFTHSPLWGITRNPWNPERTCGGSSGGSAVAVATGCVAIAEGTDMGGSIRNPAACCGLVGLKPSLGRIPMDILPTVFDDISHFGPIARCVDDAALFLEVTAGPDERDILSNPAPLSLERPVPADVTGLEVALSIDLGYYAVHAEVEARVREAARALRDAGARVTEIDLPWTREVNDAWSDVWDVYLDVCFTEDLDRWRGEMDPAVVAMIEHGRTLGAAHLRRIEQVRTRQWHALCDVFDRYDALLCPTMTMTAPVHDLTDADLAPAVDDGRYHAIDMTCPFNFVGQCPAISVPVGRGAGRLPIGAQVVGHRFDEATVLKVAAALERAGLWDGEHPVLAPPDASQAR